MKFLHPALPIALPLIVAWAKREQQFILRHGIPLDDQSTSDAIALGVKNPQNIRLLRVDRVPPPKDPLNLVIAKSTDFISDRISGMTLHYGIFVRSDCWNNRYLIAHECAHTAQYERLGGIRPFLNQYLRECLEVGYVNSPMEQEAIHKASQMRG